MARPVPLLLHAEEQGVAITIVGRGSDPLTLSRRLALPPDLLAGSAPKHGAALLERKAQRLLAHPRHHQHGAVGDILHDGGYQAVTAIPDRANLLGRSLDRNRFLHGVPG